MQRCVQVRVSIQAKLLHIHTIHFYPCEKPFASNQVYFTANTINSSTNQPPGSSERTVHTTLLPNAIIYLFNIIYFSQKMCDTEHLSINQMAICKLYSAN